MNNAELATEVAEQAYDRVTTSLVLVLARHMVLAGVTYKAAVLADLGAVVDELSVWDLDHRKADESPEVMSVLESIYRHHLERGVDLVATCLTEAEESLRGREADDRSEVRPREGGTSLSAT